MSKWRQAAKVDANQSDIVKQLRKLGYSVQVGHDDILVGHKGKTLWYEIKDPEKTLSKKTGELLPSAIKLSQQALMSTWSGHYQIVWTLEQILADIASETE